MKNTDRIQSDTCQQSDVLWPYHVSCRKKDISCGNIFANPDNIGACCNRLHNLYHCFIDGDCMLQHDHRVSSWRQDTSCCDCITGSWLWSLFGKFTHGHLAAYLKVGRQFFTGTKGFDGSDCITVHGRAWIGRQVFRGNNVVSADPAKGFLKGQYFSAGRAGRQVLLQKLPGFFKADGFRTAQHVTVSITRKVHSVLQYV